MDTDHPNAGDDWLEQALRADAHDHAAGYVSDDGFTAAVMARLPTPVALPAWRRPVIALLWLIAGTVVAAALPDLFDTVFRGLVALIVGQPLTLSHIAVALTALGAATWSTILYAMRAE